MWKTVPVIVVITKSYSVPERDRNIEMVNNAFAKQKHFLKRLRKVIPVVAATYILNDIAFAAPEGITELIDATNVSMPEGIKAGDQDIANFKLSRKRVLSHGLTAVSTTAAAVVGAVPIPFPDALILAPLEVSLVNGIARVYGISNNEESKMFFKSIVEVGTVGVAAKALINALKLIPGVNIGVAVLNAIIAGSIVAVLGEGTTFVFEQIYLGKKNFTDIEWLKVVLDEKIASKTQFIVKILTDQLKKDTDMKDLANIFTDLLRELFNNTNVKKQKLN